MKKKKNRKRFPWGQLALHVFFIIASLAYILPMVLIVSISLSGANIKEFSLLPREISLFAYKMVLEKPMQLVEAYGVTFFYSVAGVIVSMIVNVMFGYALSRPNYKFKKPFITMIFITMIFGGGMIPHYIVNSGLLHLDNTIWIYIVPYVYAAGTVIVYRTFFMNLPNEIFEAARIDGASEFRICFNVVIPMSTPILATQAYGKFLGGWNDWINSSIYIRNPRLYSLQYLLKRYMDGAGGDLLTMAGMGNISAAESVQALETVKYAMAVFGIGPAIIIFPLMQKYYDKGIVMGSLKG